MENCGGVDFKKVVNISPMASMIWLEGADTPCFVSDAISGFGYSPADFTSGKVRFESIIHPNDGEGLKFNPDCEARVYRISSSAGEWRWVSHRACSLGVSDRNEKEFLWTLSDITPQKEAEDLLRKNEEELEAFLNAVPASLLLISEDGECLKVTGSRDAPLARVEDQLMGKNLEESSLFEKAQEVMDTVRRSIETGTAQFLSFEISVGGNIFFQEARVSPVAGKFRGKRAATLVALDATASKELEKEIKLQTGHDPLEGSSNRRHLNRALLVSLAESQRTNSPLALFMIDMDKFNRVNEAIGRDMADLLLKAVAMKIQNACRQGDILYRVEGVNFYLILPRISNKEEGTIVAERVLEAVRSAASGYSGDFSLTASIGISLFPEDGPDGKTLLRAAETALYSAKTLGGNHFAFADT